MLPPSAPVYVTFEEVKRLHVLAMADDGFPPQLLRDPGALESAVQRPQNAAAYSDPDLIEQALLLLQGIADAQAYMDGNKRTAFAAFDVFLEINGLSCNGDEDELKVLVLAATVPDRGERAKAVAELDQWVRAYTR